MKVSALICLVGLPFGAVFSMAQTPEPARPGAIVPPEVPEKELKFKSRHAEVKVATRSLAEAMRTADPPIHVLTVSATVEDAPGIGPAQIWVDPPQEQPSNWLLELTISLPKKLGGWPRDCLIALKLDNKEAPSNLAAAVLIESMLAGKKISGDVVLSGGLSMDLKVLSKTYPLEPGNALAKLAAEKPGLLLVGGVVEEAVGVFDALRFGGEEAAAAIHKLQVIGCYTLDDVLELAGVVENEGLAKTLDRFEETQKIVGTRGKPILKHPKVQARIAETLTALPHHLTADHYKKIAAGKLPPHRSKYSSGTALKVLWNRVNKVVNAGPGTVAKDLGTAGEELDTLLPHLHPEAKEVAEDAATYLRRTRVLYQKEEDGKRLDTREVEEINKLHARQAQIDRAINALRK